MRFKIFFSFFLLLALHVQSVFSQPLVLNTADKWPNSSRDFEGISDKVLSEAFRRIGTGIKIVHLPSERALVNANEGIEDGNFVRVEGLDRIYSNLIRVPEAITRFEFVAFSKKVNFGSPDWRNLGNYNIGIVRGWKILETETRRSKSLVKVKNEASLFNLLMADRVDAVIYDRFQGTAFLHGMHAADVHASAPFAVKKMYLYLNKRNAGLITPLTRAIRSMKHDGTYRKIVDEVMKNAPSETECEENHYAR